MTATAGLTVPHLINPIFQYIFDCLGFNPINGNFDFVFRGLNRLWMVSVALILNGSPHKIVLLKPNVVHVILFNFCKQKFVKHSTVMLTIDRNGDSLLIFEEKWPNNATVPKSTSNIFCGEPLRISVTLTI